jgi:hypothetical protein
VISGPDAASFDINNPSLRLPHVGGTNMRISRDAALSTMTATFNRQAQHEYFFLQSPNLSTWSNPRSILSFDSTNNHSYTLTARTEAAYFLNLATVNYSQISNAPADLLSSGKKLRLKFDGGQFIDFSLNGTAGTWFDSASNRSGALINTSWQDQGANVGTLGSSQSIAHALPLGYFFTTLVDFLNPGNGTFQSWLSFHAPSTGWTEEASGGNPFRVPFELLSPNQ